MAANITPLNPRHAAFPLAFPQEMLEQMQRVDEGRFAQVRGAVDAVMQTQYAATDAGAGVLDQLTGLVLLATEADALGRHD